MKTQEILHGLGRPAVYYPKLRQIAGSHVSMIFFCQLLYWSDKGKLSDGWIYKISADIEAETGLTYREQTSARKHLVSKGLIEEKYERLRHRMLFRCNFDVLEKLITKAG